MEGFLNESQKRTVNGVFGLKTVIVLTELACAFAWFFGGSGEIRTHDGFPHAGFQDR